MGNFDVLIVFAAFFHWQIDLAGIMHLFYFFAFTNPIGSRKRGNLQPSPSDVCIKYLDALRSQPPLGPTFLHPPWAIVRLLVRVSILARIRMNPFTFLRFRKKSRKDGLSRKFSYHFSFWHHIAFVFIYILFRNVVLPNPWNRLAISKHLIFQSWSAFLI